MSSPREIISEKKKPSAADIRRAGEQALKDEQDKNKKQGDGKKESRYTKYLEKQFKFKKQKYEDQKKKELENIKKRAGQKHVERMRSALSAIKQDSISHRENEASAYGKALGNVVSLAGGLTAAGYHGARALMDKNAAKKKAKERKQRQLDKKEPGRPGRRSAAPEAEQTSQQPSQVGSQAKQLPPAPERKKLLPAASDNRGMSLGQRARRNPELKKRLIASRNEDYSDWKGQFLFENGLILEVESDEKVKKQKVIDIMKGKNSIEMNPEIMEDHKEIASGKKKDDEGYMANVELDQIERAIKALRKKVKKSDTQLPAWVQSKITRAADYIDTASEYLQSEEGITEEKEDKRYCKLCRKEETKGECSYGPSMWEKYTTSQMTPAIVSLGADDKKKNLMPLLIKALDDKKRRKNSQLINGIIGESVDKSKMKCNKPKAEAHGSGETGKSHVVKACEDGKEKLIRFGQLGVKGSPKKKGESKKYASRRRRFQTRHAKNIAKGKMSAAYWANKVKW